MKVQKLPSDVVGLSRDAAAVAARDKSAAAGYTPAGRAAGLAIPMD